MKRSFLLKLTILLLITSSLAGCLVVEKRHGSYPGTVYLDGGGDGGNHHDNKHKGH